MNDIKMGIYRHYKGQLYQVLGIAYDANTDEFYTMRGPQYVNEVGDRTVVVYMSLQIDSAHLGPRMAVRTIEDFTAIVCRGGFAQLCPHFGKQITLGSVCGQRGHAVPRFTYLGSELTEEMLLGAQI